MQGIDGPPSGGRTVNGIRYETLGFPCAGPSGRVWNCGVYMAMPQAKVAAPTRNRQVGSAMSDIPEWFVPFTRALFGEQNAQFWADCVKLGKVTPHPIWEFAADPVVAGRVALLGDAAHLSSPPHGRRCLYGHAGCLGPWDGFHRRQLRSGGAGPLQPRCGSARKGAIRPQPQSRTGVCAKPSTFRVSD
jgi:hypothetical protein